MKQPLPDAHLPALDVAVDPVCGMKVNVSTAKHVFNHQGENVYFCSRGCLDKFQADPAAFPSRGVEPKIEQKGSCCSHAPAVPAPPAGTDVEYTCPMHPEVIQIGPGACPVCGMDLEPRVVRLDEGEPPELRGMQMRFWVCLVLALPVFAIAMGDMVPALSLGHALGWRASRLIQAVLATPVVLWGGWPFFVRAWTSLQTFKWNMFTLIAIGTGTAYGYSVIAILFPGWFPESFHDMHGHVGVYFESAAVIVTLVLMGQVLELRARHRTGGALRQLLNLVPKTALVIDDQDRESEVPVAELKVGQRIRIKPGQQVPVDGVVLEGRGSVDESMVSGEPIPVEKSPGDSLTGGTVNGSGSFILEARKVGNDTLLAHIVRLVAEAQRSRAPIQRLVDQVSAWFVPAVVIIAAGSFVIWSLVGPEPRFAYALLSAVSVLIIACPCALGLATPMSIMVGTGRGAQAGILIRSAESLELFEQVDTLLVDKTGTLTEGKPRLVSLIPEGDHSENDLMLWAAMLERSSEHPLAAAILAGAETRGIAVADVKDFEYRPGQGVIGKIGGEEAALGNSALMESLGVAIESMQPRAGDLRSDGETVVFLAKGGQIVGLLGVADPIKQTSRQAVRELREEGIRVVMVTGDHEFTARAVAAELDIEEIHAGVQPEQKAEIVQRLVESGAKVAMAGDGVNDAPALARAHVGIAMGVGTDIAMESAGITLVSGDLLGIARARRLSEATLSNIRQNLFFAFVYNGLGVPIAAGALYPFIGVLLSPMIAGAAMTFSSVTVIANALRLRNLKL